MLFILVTPFNSHHTPADAPSAPFQRVMGAGADGGRTRGDRAGDARRVARGGEASTRDIPRGRLAVSPEGTVGGERKSDATARRNAARNKKDAEVLAARDAKVVSVNPFFLEKELLPKQTWPDGTPNIRAQLTSLWVLGQPHSALGVPPPPKPPRFAPVKPPDPLCCGCGPPVSCFKCFGGGMVDETEPGTPRAMGGKMHDDDLRGLGLGFDVDYLDDDLDDKSKSRVKKKKGGAGDGSDESDVDSDVQCAACVPAAGNRRRRRRRRKKNAAGQDKRGDEDELDIKRGRRRREKPSKGPCGALDCVGDWSSSDDEGSRSGGKKKSRRRRRGDGGDDGWDDEGAVRCGPNSFGGCFAFLFGPSEEVVRRRRKQRERDERRKARTALLHPGTVEDGSDAGVRVSDDEGYNSMFDDWFDEEEGDRGTDYPDWHPARASLKGEGFFANRARVYATWKPRRPIDISFGQPSVLLMSQMAFVFSQPMWRSLATFQRVDPALCAEPEPPHVTDERPDVYERLKEEARVYRVSHQTRYAYAAWSEDMLGAFLGCVFATAAWSCALRDPRNRRRRRRRKIETFFFFGVLRGWHDAASAHQARVESRRVNLELMAFLAKQQRQKRWEASLNETWDDIKAVSDGTKGAAGKTAGTGKNVARAASSEAKEDGGKSVSFTRQIVKIGKDATNAAADALGAGDDDADVGEGNAGRDAGAGDDGSGTGDGTDGVTGPAVKLRDDDGTGYGTNASSRLVSTSESAHDTEEEGEGGDDDQSGGMFDFILGGEWSARSNFDNTTDATALYDETVARALKGAICRHRNKLKGRRAFWPAVEELSLNDGAYERAKPAAAPDETEDDRDRPIGPEPIARIAA